MPDASPGTIDAAAIVATLANISRATVPVSELVAALGTDPEGVYTAIGAAEAMGLVEVWEDAPEGCSVVLGLLAASRLGLQLDSSSRMWVPLASANGHAGNGQARAVPGLEVADDVGILADIADPKQVDPLTALVDAEAAERRHGNGKPRDRSNADWNRLLPMPTHFLGTAGPWPLVSGPGALCGACLGRKLGRMDFCLWCDRWGYDGLIAPPRPSQRHAYRPGPLRGGLKGPV